MVIAIGSFVFAAAVLAITFIVSPSRFQCFDCGRFRSRTEDGWRICDHCKTRWRYGH